jgi:uncharacterized protein YbjQ (UPF0145 family)
VEEIGATLKHSQRKREFSCTNYVQLAGVVAGGDARSKNLLKDIVAALGGIFGGEATFYSHLLNESSVSC